MQGLDELESMVCSVLTASKPRVVQGFVPGNLEGSRGYNPRFSGSSRSLAISPSATGSLSCPRAAGRGQRGGALPTEEQRASGTHSLQGPFPVLAPSPAPQTRQLRPVHNSESSFTVLSCAAAAPGTSLESDDTFLTKAGLGAVQLFLPLFHPQHPLLSFPKSHSTLSLSFFCWDDEGAALPTLMPRVLTLPRLSPSHSAPVCVLLPCKYLAQWFTKRRGLPSSGGWEIQ